MMFIIGDSHAIAIKGAAMSLGIAAGGGCLDGGRNLNGDFYRRDGRDFRFNDEKVDGHYRSFLQEAGFDNFAAIDCPILCLFGMNIHYLSRAQLWAPFAVDPSQPGQFLSQAVVRETLRGMIPGALSFYRDALDMGHRVFSALPPRRTPTRDTQSIPAIFQCLEDQMVEELTTIGVTVVDHRPWSLDPQGQLKIEYVHADAQDDVHGGKAFGRDLLFQVMRHKGVKA